MTGSSCGGDNVALIRNKVKLFDVVSKKIKLTKRGGNHYVGLCPFHSEKTPSFNVNCDNELFYCFGCGVSGDVIQFVSDTEGLDFKQAMTHLAQMYGVALQNVADNKNEFDPMFEAMERAAYWASGQLFKGKQAMAYLKGRGINGDTIRKFRLGYIPPSGLKAHLLAAKVSLDVIRDSGLLSKSGQDCLYNRITFPICNSMGRVISFGGRSMDPNHSPKYLNSAENALFKKRESLYGLNLALPHARKAGKMVVVEGYMDVLILSQLGVQNVVGVLGTAMSEYHLRNLWGIVPEVIIWMDGDKAGSAASVKIARTALSIMKQGESVRFVSGIVDKDPYDVCITRGLDEVMSFIDGARLLSEFIWEYEKSCIDTHGVIMPEQCMLLETRIQDYTSKIKDPKILKYYKEFFYQQIRSLQNPERTRYNKYYAKRNTTDAAVVAHHSTLHKYRLNDVPLKACIEENYQIRVLQIVLEHPELLAEASVFDQFANIDFNDNGRRLLQQHIVDIIGADNTELSNYGLLEELISRAAGLKGVLHSLIGYKDGSKDVFSTGATADNVRVEWQKLMLSRELSEIHEQIIESRLNDRNDIATMLSERAREIDDELRNLWSC